MDIYTIGHSTHSKEKFLSMLNAYEITLLVDVRSFPGSRHVPQFNQEQMKQWLPSAGVQYLHLPELGGRRRRNIDLEQSLVAGWRHASFRNYAGYALTSTYALALESLTELAKKECVCLMCAESVPWRCHRSIIANNLTVQNCVVFHIMSETKATIHAIGNYGAIPVVQGNRLTYPAQDQE